MAKKRIKKQGQKQRLVELEIDEISLVDKPAIGETFIITKRMEGKDMGKKKKGDNKPTVKALLKKGNGWSASITKFMKEEKHKAVDDTNTHCKFCGISAEDEAKATGLGLLCSCCFTCAVERYEKGVFQACIEGTFDFDKYKEENPKEFAKDDDTDDGKQKSETSDEDDTADTADNADDTDDSGDDTDDSADDDDGKETETEKRVDAVEKKLSDVETMLQTSLEFHSQAAGFLNSIVAMTLDALDMMTSLREESSDTEKTKAAVTELKKSMTQFRENKDIQKAGAKISGARMNALQEIADRLNALIQSVASAESADNKDGKKGGKKAKATVKAEEFEALKKNFDDLQKSLADNDGADVETIKSLKEQLETAVTKVDELANRLNDVEKGAGASSELDDDDDDDDTSDSEGGSVFKGFGPLSDVSERIQKNQRTTSKKK